MVMTTCVKAIASVLIIKRVNNKKDIKWTLNYRYPPAFIDGHKDRVSNFLVRTFRGWFVYPPIQVNTAKTEHKHLR